MDELYRGNMTLIWQRIITSHFFKKMFICCKKTTIHCRV